MTDSLPTDRATVRTHRERSAPDEAAAILAAGIVAHVAFADAHGPVVIPMTYQYDPADPERIHLHGGHHSRLMQLLESGARISIAVTLTDGLVASKTALNHSVNYRSVVVFGRAAAPLAPEAARDILHAMVHRYWPDRHVGVDFAPIPDRDLNATAFVAIEIEQMSAKIRRGGPKGPHDADPAVPGTAGVFPIPDLTAPLAS
jgi:nitroimidazol reductase NimA-like FMN-containing flavoprotein (pyridoxamine 5'-phosphate oxidase superfamily)